MSTASETQVPSSSRRRVVRDHHPITSPALCAGQCHHQGRWPEVCPVPHQISRAEDSIGSAGVQSVLDEESNNQTTKEQGKQRQTRIISSRTVMQTNVCSPSRQRESAMWPIRGSDGDSVDVATAQLCPGCLTGRNEGLGPLEIPIFQENQKPEIFEQLHLSLMYGPSIFFFHRNNCGK